MSGKKHKKIRIQYKATTKKTKNKAEQFLTRLSVSKLTFSQ